METKVKIKSDTYIFGDWQIIEAPESGWYPYPFWGRPLLSKNNEFYNEKGVPFITINHAVDSSFYFGFQNFEAKDANRFWYLRNAIYPISSQYFQTSDEAKEHCNQFFKIINKLMVFI